MRCRLLILLSVCLFSCADNNGGLPEGIMKPDKMQDVFWDFIRSDVFVIEFVRIDSNHARAIENLRMQNKIFADHKITKEEFYKSYTYYSNHKELMSTMIDSMIARKQRERITRKKPILKSL